MARHLDARGGPALKNDVFLSYAHVDDTPLEGASSGWVSTLVRQIRILLAQELGRAESVKIWFDQSALRGNHPLSDEIRAQVATSTLLLPVLSPGYFASDWCAQELAEFVARHGPNARQIFPVYLRDVRETRGARTVKDLRGYQFWYRDQSGQPRIFAVPRPDPAEHSYYALVQDLVRDLADYLRTVRETERPGDTPASASERRPLAEATVFLAEVPRPLEERRNQMRRYLEQQGAFIVPERSYDIESLQKELTRDLQKSSLFVQILGTDATFGIPVKQYNAAKAAGVPIVQWRPPDVQMNEVDQQNHRQLLDGADVLATGFVEFQEYVVRRLQRRSEGVTPPAGVLVFVNAAPEDMPLAQLVSEICEKNGIGYSLPLQLTDSIEVTAVREDLENNLLTCDAVIILYGATPVLWVRRQLFNCKRMQGKRDVPLRLIAVYTQPAGETRKPELNLRMPEVHLLDCPVDQLPETLPRILRGAP